MRNEPVPEPLSVRMPEDIVKEGLAAMLKTLRLYDAPEVPALAKEVGVILDRWYRKKSQERRKAA